MKFVLTLVLLTSACGPVSRINEAETTDNRRTNASPETSTIEQGTEDTSPVPQTALTPLPQTTVDPETDETLTSSEAVTPQPSSSDSATPQDPTDSTTPQPSSDTSLPQPSSSDTVIPEPPSEADPEELDIEERTGRAEDFSEHALVFDLDEYGLDKKQIFERAERSTSPEWVSGLGFLFPEESHPVQYKTSEALALFRGFVTHAAVRLFQHQKQKSTVFRLTLFGDEIVVHKKKDEDKHKKTSKLLAAKHDRDDDRDEHKGKAKGHDKIKDKKKGEEKGKHKDHEHDKEKKNRNVKARSRLIVELAIKNGRPLLQLQSKIAGQKAKNARIKGKARLPANQEIHLVASLKGNMLRLYTGTHLIGETKVETLDEKWARGELVIGASHGHGKAPFVGFLRELEFADSVPLEYQ